MPRAIWKLNCRQRSSGPRLGRGSRFYSRVGSIGPPKSPNRGQRVSVSRAPTGAPSVSSVQGIIEGERAQCDDLKAPLRLRGTLGKRGHEHHSHGVLILMEIGRKFVSNPTAHCPTRTLRVAGGRRRRGHKNAPFARLKNAPCYAHVGFHKKQHDKMLSVSFTGDFRPSLARKWLDFLANGLRRAIPR